MNVWFQETSHSKIIGKQLSNNLNNNYPVGGA